MRKALAVVFAVLTFNLIFFPFQKNFFGFLTIPNIATVGFVALMVAYQAFLNIAFYDSSDNRKKNTLISLVAVSLGLSIISLFRTSMVDIIFFNLVSFLATVLTTYIYTLPKGESVDSLFEVMITPIALFFESIIGFFRGVKTFRIPKLGFVRLPSGLFAVLAGFILGLPVVFLITALLSSADPVFSKFVTNLFTFKNFPWWFVRGSVSRLILSALFALGAVAVAYIKIKKQTAIDPSEKLEQATAGRHTSLMALSIVGMVAFVLGTFLVVGYRYLFANVPETELHQFGVNTLSEYVTKGFTELIIVSIVVYISSALAVMIYKLGGKGSNLLKWFNIFLLSETVVFVLSIFRRVAIYQETHGLTRVRIYGSIFLTALIVLTVFLMFRHARRKVKWFWGELSVLVLASLIIFFARPDYLIATKYKPTVNGEVDYVHIVRLSPEAVDGWLEAYHDAKKWTDTLSSEDVVNDYNKERKAYYTFLTLNILRQKYKTLTLKYGSAQEIFDARATHGRARPANDIKSVNFAEQSAYRKLREEIDVKELINYEEKAYKLVYGGRVVPQGTFKEKSNLKQFDRSLESPLLQEVRIER